MHDICFWVPSEATGLSSLTCGVVDLLRYSLFLLVGIVALVFLVFSESPI